MDRRDYLAAVSATGLSAISGCAGTRYRISKELDQVPEVQSSGTTLITDQAVEGQPSAEEQAPAAWGTLLYTPEGARRRVDWGTLEITPTGELPNFIEQMDIGEEFVTILVGALPYGMGITRTGGEPNPEFTDNLIKYDVTTYEATSEDRAEYGYHYTLTLWRSNGQRVPDEITVELQEDGET